MVLKKLTIQAPVGLYYVTHPELIGANVISVKRNGARFYLIDELPTGSLPNVQHNGAEGRLYFSQSLPFNYAALDETGARLIEYVFVIYTNGGGIITETPPIEPVDPEPPPPPEPTYNFIVENNLVSDNYLLIVTPEATYSIITGVFAINPGDPPVNAAHGGFTAILKVTALITAFDVAKLQMFKNATLIECINMTAGENEYSFTIATFSSSEICRIKMEAGTC